MIVTCGCASCVVPVAFTREDAELLVRALDGRIPADDKEVRRREAVIRRLRAGSQTQETDPNDPRG